MSVEQRTEFGQGGCDGHGGQMEQTPTVGERHPFNLREAQAAEDFVASRYEYLIERRDDLLDRIRFGSLKLNGASLLALLAALGGKGEAATWLGFTAQTTRISAALFLVGAISAGISILLEANVHRTQSGDAFQRLSAATLHRSSYDNADSPANDQLTGRLMIEYQKSPLVDFKFSAPALWAQSVSTGLWLAGIVVPMSHALGFVW
jgi:hypothetical protein